ncbi:MAG: ABC transporter permease [Acidobacteria bacterium]|nr:ABC transporter permease [Acidobacteriota bacterium]
MSQPRRTRAAWRNIAQHRLALVGSAILLFFLLCGLFAPWLAPHDPTHLHLSARLLPPSTSHWFGTDELGRDVLSRTLYGARVSLSVAIAVVAISVALGVTLGMLAGFYGGFTDTVINIYLGNAFLSLPGILLAITIVAFLGPSLANLVLALALAAWVNYARLVRAQVLSVKEREYVQAARSLGASDLHLMLRHILPNILQPLLVQAAVGMAAAVLAEATLSFLGLGVQPPTPTWGAMLNDARSHLFESPYLMFFPAAALALCVFSFNLIGDGLRDLLDPRTKLLDSSAKLRNGL